MSSPYEWEDGGDGSVLHEIVVDPPTVAEVQSPVIEWIQSPADATDVLSLIEEVLESAVAPDDMIDGTKQTEVTDVVITAEETSKSPAEVTAMHLAIMISILSQLKAAEESAEVDAIPSPAEPSQQVSEIVESIWSAVEPTGIIPAETGVPHSPVKSVPAEPQAVKLSPSPVKPIFEVEPAGIDLLPMPSPAKLAPFPSLQLCITPRVPQPEQVPASPSFCSSDEESERETRENDSNIGERLLRLRLVSVYANAQAERSESGRTSPLLWMNSGSSKNATPQPKWKGRGVLGVFNRKARV